MFASQGDSFTIRNSSDFKYKKLVMIFFGSSNPCGRAIPGFTKIKKVFYRISWYHGMVR